MKLTNWRRGPYPKKYSVDIDGLTTSFGDVRFEQYEDSSPLKLYSNLDHRDPKRRRLFLIRHARNHGLAAQLAKKYLW